MDVNEALEVQRKFMEDMRDVAKACLARPVSKDAHVLADAHTIEVCGEQIALIDETLKRVHEQG